ncbi:MAG: hypothetical protein WCP35_15470 [Verrucomicrobiota bacterium]
MQEATGAAGPDGFNPVMRGNKFLGGRPDLALSGNARVAAVNQIRTQNGIPDVRGHEAVNKEATTWEACIILSTARLPGDARPPLPRHRCRPLPTSQG